MTRREARRWWQDRWVRRVGAILLGFGLAASCALLPEEAQAACRAAAQVAHAALGGL